MITTYLERQNNGAKIERLDEICYFQAVELNLCALFPE